MSPSDLVLYDGRIASKLQQWSRLKAGLSQGGLDAEKVRMAGDKVVQTRWYDAGAYMFCREIVQTRDADLEKLYLDLGYLAVGRLNSLNDPDFVFALQHSGLNEAQQFKVLGIRGDTLGVCYGEVPEFIISRIALGLRDSEESRNPEQSFVIGAILMELQYVGAGLNGLELQYVEQEVDYKLDGLLDLPVDRDRIRSVARKEFPKALAELNATLLLRGSQNDVWMRTNEDFAAVQAVADHALRDFPDGYRVQLTAGVAYLHSGKRIDEGIQLLRHLADTSDLPTFQCLSNCYLGREYIRRADYQTAQTRLKLAAEKCPENPDPLYLLFKAQVAANDVAAAQQTRDRFLKLEPNSKRSNELKKVVLPAGQ